MAKVLIVSNRLPLSIQIDNDKIDIQPSVGGLATGMNSVHKTHESEWIGWTGLVNEEISETIKPEINKALKEANCIDVPLSAEEVELFYFGFSNKTIWPLFHYFTEFAEYDKTNWEAYKLVNKKFADKVVEVAKPGDKVWVQDYQLLLVPQLIKEQRQDIDIGFFLHIPFPSFEVFRILPWRKEILNGLMGADLIGFHTYDYQRHFSSSVRRILGYEISFNEISCQNRIVLVDSFPMGIDYDKFHNAAIAHQQKSIRDKSDIQKELDKYILMRPEVKLILSIDRLDYTKGIAKRLLAFEYFLEKYPEFKDQITLIMLAVPSRENVDQYIKMKNEVDQLVGRINGKFSNINWTPVWYFYRSMPFDNLIDLYTTSEIALLTPIRDGMNLVAKEYIATKTDQKGVLILSEMAGAAKEMSEALVINPNNLEEVADSIREAILMPEKEQIERNTLMQKRLKRYNVEKWATDFMKVLESVHENKKKYLSKKLNASIKEELREKYIQANKRTIFLDYDGTLVTFKGNPEDAKPDEELYEILDKLASDPKNEVVLISGRDKETFTKWFGDKNYTLVVEHGVWTRKPGKDWKLIEQMDISWMDTIRNSIQFYVDRTPGSFIENKNYSMVWHYRKSDPELGIIRANELKDELTSFIANHDLEIMEGNKVIEVKNSGVNKGRAALQRINNKQIDFMMGIGDDWTDEYLFERLPDTAVTIKVGMAQTQAKYRVEGPQDVRNFLKSLL